MSEEERNRFLIAMYNQLMNDINRHIMVVWQSIATLVAAIAALGLVEKKVITLDVAATIVIITAFWLILHVIDASYWYNRNLVIIANIERQFLKENDLREIHYYFGKHRPDNKMISHLKIQLALALTLIALILIFHSYTILWPKIYDFELMTYLPLVITILGAAWSYCFKESKDENYAEFLQNSPGININAVNVKYGKGHGFKNIKS